MYEASKSPMLSAACEPCKPSKTPVFKMGDVVEHIQSKDVFKIGTITSKYGELYYSSILPDHTQNFHFHDRFEHGGSLRLYKVGKK
jgi:hypothetical protein